MFFRQWQRWTNSWNYHKYRKLWWNSKNRCCIVRRIIMTFFKWSKVISFENKLLLKEYIFAKESFASLWKKKRCEKIHKWMAKFITAKIRFWPTRESFFPAKNLFTLFKNSRVSFSTVWNNHTTKQIIWNYIL